MSTVEIVDDALELGLIATMASTMIDKVHHDRLRQAVEDSIDQIFGQLVERSIRIGVKLLKDRFQHPTMPTGVCRRTRPGGDRALVEGL